MGTENNTPPTSQECFAEAAAMLKKNGSSEHAREWRILGEVIYRTETGF